jgi:hypothetical protein
VLASAPAADLVKLVVIVRDEDEVRGGLSRAVGSGEPQVQRRGVWPEQFGQHVGRGPQLRVPVLRGPHDRGVDPQRGVVDEHAAVDLRQVDAPLRAVGERVQRADDVVAVQAEVEGEVVPRPSGHHYVRDAVRRGHGRHQGLRPVAARHADDVGAAGDRVLREPHEVVAGLEHDRLDAPCLALVLEVESRRLPATRLGVHDQDRPRFRQRRRRRGKRGMPGAAQRHPRATDGHRGEQERHEDEGPAQVGADQTADQQPDGAHRGDQPQPADEAAPRDDIPPRHHGDQLTGQREDHPQPVADRARDKQGHGRGQRQEGQPRRCSSHDRHEGVSVSA